MIYKLESNRVRRSYLGGRQIDRLYGHMDTHNGYHPEDWAASTVLAVNPGYEKVNEGLSRTRGGALLRDLIQADPVSHLGVSSGEMAHARMSILVKLLDAAERLVIQVHPTRAFARQYFNSPFGKTESWYVIRAADDACVYLGFKPGITRNIWKRCFEKQDIEAMLSWLHRLAVEPGDVIFVAGGVPHAIGTGCFMLELQEPTDLLITTERQTPSGVLLPDRKLHAGIGFEKMFDCFIYEGLEEREIRKRYFLRKTKNASKTVQTLIDDDITDQFFLQELNIDGTLEIEWTDTYAVAVVIHGHGSVQPEGSSSSSQYMSLKAGDQLFISADTGPVTWSGKLQAIVSCPGKTRISVKSMS